MTTLSVDVLVVGAGQAGLAAGYRLRDTGLAFLLVDGASRIGDSWRHRWDSLTLFTPAAFSALPGLELPGDPGHYPTRDEIADYLEVYGGHFQLPVRLGDQVVRLERNDGEFLASLSSGTHVRSRAVIVASGAFQVPAVPQLARTVGVGVRQLTPNSYRNPASVPSGTVLIVGDGATGRQIALDLAETHRVLLATGRARRVIPDRVLGRSVFWWLDRLGILWSSRASLIGRFLRARDPFPGRHLTLQRLRQAGVRTAPRIRSILGERVTFVDGSQDMVNAVVWATGYRDETGWMAVGGALDAEGRTIEAGGESPIPGLYYIGRSWQRSRGSALLHGVGQDARLIVDRVSEYVCNGSGAGTGGPSLSAAASSRCLIPSPSRAG